MTHILNITLYIRFTIFIFVMYWFPFR